jgi:hypothetical protein
MPERVRVGGKDVVFSRLLLCPDDKDVSGAINIGSLVVPFALKILDLPKENRFKVSINPVTLAITVEMAKGGPDENVVTVHDQPIIELRGKMLSLMFWSQRIGVVNAILLQFLYDQGESS